MPARLKASAAVWILALAGLVTGQGLAAQEPLFDSPATLSYVDGVASVPGSSEGVPGGSQAMPGLIQPTPCAFAEFYVDYRIRRFSSSHTSYEVGWSYPQPMQFGIQPIPTLPNPNPTPNLAKPLSRVEFPLNSTWTGLELGVENPSWAVRAEWLIPISNNIDGQAMDRDWLWQFVGLPPQMGFSNFSVWDQRWVNGQMVDVDVELKLWEGLLGVPIAVWPVGGFRWQKFDIMGFNLTELRGFDTDLYEFIWFSNPMVVESDAVRFRQEFYHYYGGGQLRTEFGFGGMLPPVKLTFQGDWAQVQAFNYDHHKLLDGTRVRKQITDGHALHFGVTAEMFLLDSLTLGVEGEYTQIRTYGSHQDINVPLAIDETRQNDARVWSDQTAITVFVRLRR